MIQVQINKQKNNIVKVSIFGHANENNNSKIANFICAGVSSIAFGALNSLVELEKKENFKIKKKENNIEIIVLKSTIENQIILKTVIIQFETIQYKYNKLIKIIYN